MKACKSDIELALQSLANALREAGWWTSKSPSQQALDSDQPFCVDSMTFSQWLQWVYIPKMQLYLNRGKVLPNDSGLTPIAIEAWKGCEDKTGDLLAIIRILDALSNDENVDGALKSLSRFHPSH